MTDPLRRVETVGMANVERLADDRAMLLSTFDGRRSRARFPARQPRRDCPAQPSVRMT